jgi:hypothetical protein
LGRTIYSEVFGNQRIEFLLVVLYLFPEFKQLVDHRFNVFRNYEAVMPFEDIDSVLAFDFVWVWMVRGEKMIIGVG